MMLIKNKTKNSRVDEFLTKVLEKSSALETDEMVVVPSG